MTLRLRAGVRCRSRSKREAEARRPQAQPKREAEARRPQAQPKREAHLNGIIIGIDVDAILA